MREAFGERDAGEPPVEGTGGTLRRADAHVHTRASSGPALAALGLLGIPECYSEPEAVYDLAMARGMDLVAITDHDTIDGAMELVERGFERVVVGEEVTVYFPEDRCKLHVLVWCLSPAQHDQIGRLGLRADVYAFARWLRDQNLPHSLAHPLYVQNRRLTPRHLDRCALLFKGFETLNGAHSGTHRTALEAYLAALTPAKVLKLVDEHGLEPLWPRIWEKGRTGGSDDHGLLNVGRTWTVIRSESARLDGREFFRQVMGARSDVGGVAGHSSLLAHQLATVGMHWAARKVLPKRGVLTRYALAPVLAAAGARVERPSKARGALAGRKIRRKKTPALVKAIVEAARPIKGPNGKWPKGQRGQRACAPSDFAHLQPLPKGGGPALAQHEDMAAFWDDLHDAASRLLTSAALKRALARDAKGFLDQVSAQLVLELAQLPYYFSLFHQNKERDLVQRIAHESQASPVDKPLKVCLFTDTLGDVNGVSRFIRNVADQAQATGRDLTVFTSTRFEIPEQQNIRNFDPLAATRMPKYENLELVLPPALRMLRAADALQPDVIHISTPGPVGLVGLMAARMLRVPVVGVYHTDFPAYLEHLFGDPSLTYMTGQSMKFFYSRFAAIFSRSEDYAESLVKLGMEREKLLRLKPGIKVESFQPRFADRAIWASYPPARRSITGRCGAAGGVGGEPVRVLSCGRVSVEKNMPMLVEVWKKTCALLRENGAEAELIVVGDGPYKASMEEELADTPTRFLGFKYGDELSRIYASSDLFVFPSITDTLGQVVMESQSSGLPVIVSDQGGPKEVVDQGRTGFVLPATRPSLWADRIVDLVVDTEKRLAMGHAAHEWMQDFSMERSFEHYWSVHERVRREWLAGRGVTGERKQEREPMEVVAG